MLTVLLCCGILIGIGKSMTAIKVGSLKCRVEQINGSILDVTLNEVKYVPDVWVKKTSKNRFNLSNKGIKFRNAWYYSVKRFDLVVKPLQRLDK